MAQRDLLIQRAYALGFTLRSIAAATGLSLSRIRSITKELRA